MAVFTNVGLTLLATGLQNAGANVAVTYVEVGIGAGTLSSPLVSGNPYTSLPLTNPLTVNIANGQSLTIVDALGDTQIVNCTGDIIGDPAIAVTSFNANANYASGSGVVNTPAVTDTALQVPIVRLTAPPGVAGAAAGESLNTCYFDPTQPTNTYIEVGFYGGSTATSAIGSGTLIARDVQWWNHVLNTDSASFQLDSTL